MNKKILLYGCGMICALLVLVILFMPGGKTYQLNKIADSADYPNEYLPCMYWDGKYYEKYEIIDEEEVKPNKLYPMLDGKDLAMYTDGRWWRLQCE